MKKKIWCLWQVIVITKNPRLIMITLDAFLCPWVKIWNYRFFPSGSRLPDWAFDISSRGKPIPSKDYDIRFIQPSIIIKDTTSYYIRPITGSETFIDVISISINEDKNMEAVDLSFRKPTTLIIKPIFMWWEIFLIGMFSLLIMSVINLQ